MTKIDECAYCGRPRADHGDNIWRACGPGRQTYYRPKYDFEGRIDCDHVDEPTCPRCGARDMDWQESFDGGDGETTRMECECGAVYDCTIHVSYSFSSAVPDLEAAAREAARALMSPGTRVRRREDGIMGTVANSEPLSAGFVFVDFGTGRLWLEAPEDLEVIADDR